VKYNTSRARVALTELQLKAVSLRRQGLQYTEIAQELGVSVNKAWNLVEQALRAWDKYISETASELRQLELQRLDEMWKAIYPHVKLGKPEYVDRALKLMERRAKLLGLDLPVQVDVTARGPLEITLKWDEWEDRGS